MVFHPENLTAFGRSWLVLVCRRHENYSKKEKESYIHRWITLFNGAKKYAGARKNFSAL